LTGVFETGEFVPRGVLSDFFEQKFIKNEIFKTLSPLVLDVLDLR